MGSYPALPSGNNPAAGAAASYANGAANIYNSLQSRLQAAAQYQSTLANQQANAQQAQQHQTLQAQMQALNDGFIVQPAPARVGAQPATAATPAGAGPYGAPAQPGLPASNGMIDRTGNAPAPSSPSTPGAANGGVFDSNAQAPAQQYSFDPSRSVQIGDKTYYKPTDRESGKTYVPQGQVGEVAKLAGWDGKTPVTGEFSHSLMMAYNEAQPKDEPSHLDTSGKFLDADGKPAPVIIGDKSGKVRMLDLSGVKSAARPSTPGTANGGPFDSNAFTLDPSANAQTAPSSQQSAPSSPASAFSFSPKEAAEKPDVSQIIPGMQGPKGGPLIYDKTSQTMKEITPVPGSKGVLNADQADRSADRKLSQQRLTEDQATRADNKAQAKAAADQVRENQAAKDHEAAGLKKEAMQGMAQGFYDAAGTKPGETYFPPRYVNGIVTPGPATLMPSDKDQVAERQAALKTTAQGFEKTAKTHQNEQERIEKAHGWGKFAPPAAGAAAPAQPQAAPPVAPPPQAAAPAQTATPAVQEGTVIVNRQTKQRQMWKGGQWVPAPAQ